MKKKEILKDGVLNEKRMTVIGIKTILELNSEIGLPKAVIKLAKVEAKTGLTSAPTIVVERFVDAELHYTKDIILNSIPNSIVSKLNLTGIEKVFVRHPKYSPMTMVMATKKEISNAGK